LSYITPQLNTEPVEEASGPAFRRTFALVIAALVVLVGVFAGLGLTQGPKLSSAQVDTDGVVAQSGQQLRLFTNQAVAAIDADQLTIVPAVPATVTASGDVIAVQFDEPLLYNTVYTVEVTGVTSPYVAQPSTLSYEFRTGAPEMYYLDRGEGEDQIIRTGILTTEREIVYTAPRIQDYAVFDNSLAVVTLRDDGSSALALVNADGNVEDIRMPGVGTLDLARSSSTTGYFGFTFTGTDSAGTVYNQTLFVVNLVNSRVVTPVAGIEGLPIVALGWEFVPTSTRIVVHTDDLSVLLIDVAEEGSVIPLGQFTEFENLSTDGSTLVVADPFGPLALSIATGDTQRLNASSFNGEIPSGGAVTVLPDDRWVQQVAVFDEESGRFVSAIVVDDGVASKSLFRTLNDEGSIESFSISPNNQYVVIETVPNVATSASDSYEANGRSTSITTVFVDIETGAVVKSLEGFRVSW
jgi:hypothetical protein